jgi:hypothetical protein
MFVKLFDLNYSHLKIYFNNKKIFFFEQKTLISYNSLSDSAPSNASSSISSNRLFRKSLIKQTQNSQSILLIFQIHTKYEDFLNVENFHHVEFV